MTASESQESQQNKPAQSDKRGGRHRRWPAAIAAVVLLAGIVLVLVLTFMPSEEEAAEQPEREVPVEMAEVGGMTLRETVRGVGTLRASEAVAIRSEVAGRVRSIEFEEGSAVSEGQLLIQIDDEKLSRQLASRQAALRAAQVRVENARRTFQRQQQLRERGVVSEDEYDQAESQLNSAEADVDELEANVALIQQQIDDTSIRAPFDGRISQQLVDRGAYVNVGDDLARLYQTDPLEMAFSLPERYMNRVSSGQAVAIHVAAHPDRAFEGVVDFISPAIEEATRDILVKANVANPDNELKPGGFATAVVTIGERTDRPVVPEMALVATRRGYSVFVIEEGRAVMRDVRTGLRREGMVEIVEGVELGDQIVEAGQLRLSGGERVRVVDEAQQTTPASDVADVEPQSRGGESGTSSRRVTDLDAAA